MPIPTKPTTATSALALSHGIGGSRPPVSQKALQPPAHRPSDTYLTPAEAAAIARLSLRTLERFRQTGTGPRFIKAGRKVLYRRADLDAWMEANTFLATSQAV